MLEFCTTCGFMGFEAAEGSEFERLNNAIVRASMRGPGWAKLADEWHDEVVEERNWKIGIPPLWTHLMKTYWTRYAELYSLSKNKTGLANPREIAPSGISGALKDLYAPTVQLTEEAQRAVTRVITQAKDEAVTQLKKLAKEVGREATKGAADEATDWGVWLAGLGVLAAAGYFTMRKR